MGSLLIIFCSLISIALIYAGYPEDYPYDITDYKDFIHILHRGNGTWEYFKVFTQAENVAAVISTVTTRTRYTILAYARSYRPDLTPMIPNYELTWAIGK